MSVRPDLRGEDEPFVSTSGYSVAPNADGFFQDGSSTRSISHNIRGNPRPIHSGRPVIKWRLTRHTRLNPTVITGTESIKERFGKIVLRRLNAKAANLSEAMHR